MDAQLDARKVEVFISFGGTTTATCPECGAICSRDDPRTRTWRHLDTMQYRTLRTAEIPRVRCSKHGVKQVKVQDAGAVHVFVHDEVTTWEQKSHVKASNTGAGDHFGWSVALSGDGETLG